MKKGLPPRLLIGILAAIVLAGLIVWALKAPRLIEPVRPVPFTSPAP